MKNMANGRLKGTIAQQKWNGEIGPNIKDQLHGSRFWNNLSTLTSGNMTQAPKKEPTLSELHCSIPETSLHPPTLGHLHENSAPKKR